MAGRGPPPKDPKLRQRTNKTSTAATLSVAPSPGEVPELPAPRDDGAPWHPKVIEWWESVWQSPMAPEFLEVDMRGGLYLLADLHQVRWTATSRTGLLEAAREIRLQEVRFGLSPIDRRRLQWTIEQGESAKERMEAKRKASGSVEDPGEDPRKALKVV